MRYFFGVLFGFLIAVIVFFHLFEPAMYLCDDTFGCDEVFYHEYYVNEDGETRSKVVAWEEKGRWNGVMEIKGYHWSYTYRTDLRHYWKLK